MCIIKTVYLDLPKCHAIQNGGTKYSTFSSLLVDMVLTHERVASSIAMQVGGVGLGLLTPACEPWCISACLCLWAVGYQICLWATWTGLNIRLDFIHKQKLIGISGWMKEKAQALQDPLWALICCLFFFLFLSVPTI